ncbi:Zn-ribbon domain-containing protein [Methanolobus sp.]|uniref:Zn-ribbon domain-containing protein n=1 Tax=Methanolobus sp. TaxID=1874737 RepID=UPI0025FEAE95|nr:Zn-ribbon domain-containing protein [Methanolobus sp.]
MPHKCTRCESIFDDGAPVILSGCPSCGWNKFLYVKEEEKERAEKEASEGDKGEAGRGTEHHTVIDESSGHKPEDKPAGKIIREIDEIIGPEKKDRSISEDEGERVESVRILGPGSYELNLESLFDRKEIVMAIKEDGTYALHLSSMFKRDKDRK